MGGQDGEIFGSRSVRSDQEQNISPLDKLHSFSNTSYLMNQSSKQYVFIHGIQFTVLVAANGSLSLSCHSIPEFKSHWKLSLIIIHQIFSLARDWSKRVTWANILQLKLGNIRGYSPIFKTARVA